jgi:hypothetical protein
VHRPRIAVQVRKGRVGGVTHELADLLGRKAQQARLQGDRFDPACRGGHAYAAFRRLAVAFVRHVTGEHLVGAQLVDRRASFEHQSLELLIAQRFRHRKHP